jgi:hypothetical protein
LVDGRKAQSAILAIAQVTGDFNDEVKFAIDDAIRGIVGVNVLQSLYEHLKNRYDITSEEIPYRLDILFQTLEHTFGAAGARTLTNATAKRIYLKYNLQFTEIQGYRLQDYLEQAKKQLAERVSE